MTEATLSAAEIEQMLDAGTVDIKDGQIVHLGDLSGTMINKDANTATVYDRRTGVPSTILLYEGEKSLIKALGKKVNGERVFTTNRPTGFERIDTHPCLLNPKHPQYEEFRAMGMPICKGESLASEQDMLQHVKNKHRNEWRLIEEKRRNEAEAARLEKEQEDREIARKTAEAMLKAVEAMSQNQTTGRRKAAEE